MAASNFTIEFSGSADKFVAKVKTAIEGAGGTLSGAPSSGSFSIPTPLGKVEGSHAISGQTAEFAIDSKPSLVPSSTIESKLRNFLDG